VTCLGCDVIAGRVRPPGGVIHEDEHWLLAHSVSPVLLRGWLVLVPKRHVEDVGALTPQEAATLGPVTTTAAAALQAALAAERIYVCSLGGEPHLHVHFHFIPRLSGMPRGAWRVLATMWSEERPWACADEEAETAAEAVRQAWR
jgi:diadenosine tetraphosphate (Ap4A) HIT family hydrolase